MISDRRYDQCFKVGYEDALYATKCPYDDPREASAWADGVEQFLLELHAPGEESQSEPMYEEEEFYFDIFEEEPF